MTKTLFRRRTILHSGYGPAVAMLRDDLALRVDQKMESLELVGLTEPGARQSDSPKVREGSQCRRAICEATETSVPWDLPFVVRLSASRVALAFRSRLATLFLESRKLPSQRFQGGNEWHGVGQFASRPPVILLC